MQVDHIRPMLKAPGIKLLKLKHDKPLANFAFKFNFRRYSEVDMGRALADRERGTGVRVRQDLGKYCRHVIVDMRFAQSSYLSFNGIL